jgi:hypothetical protein
LLPFEGWRTGAAVDECAAAAVRAWNSGHEWAIYSSAKDALDIKARDIHAA